jgi:hypothetical protein
MISKKKLLIIGIFIGICWFLIFIFNLNLFSVGGSCHNSYVGFCGSASTFIENISIWIDLLLPLFLLSLITYKMSDEVYRAWFRFVRWWVPATIVLVLLSPSYGHGLIPVDKGRVSLLLSGLFLLISLVIIIIKRVSLGSKA